MVQVSLLVIEDDPDVTEDLPRLLGDYGIACDSILIGPDSRFEEIAERLRSHAYDCVMLDLRMPPLSGMSPEETQGGRITGVLVSRRIRDLDAQIPILVFTNVSDPGVHALARQAGANRIIDKPRYPDEVAQEIRFLVPKD